MLPAARTTTSRASMNSFSVPRISVWAGSGWWPRCYAWSTVCRQPAFACSIAAVYPGST